MSHSNLSRLTALIEEEKTALLSGDLDRIAELFDEKEALVAELKGMDEPVDLAPLASQLRRNQVLFDQALEGIQNVSNRISELRRVQKGIETYDARGNGQVIDCAPHKKEVERRA